MTVHPHRVELSRPDSTGASPAGKPSANSTSRAATSPVSTGWNRKPAATGSTGSLASCRATDLVITSPCRSPASSGA